MTTLIRFGERLISNNFRHIILFLVLSGFSLGVYLLASLYVYRSGYPLDDAWIHQTYARNLAVHREWSFIPGQLSAGSTAPLWSVLLSVGYWTGLAPKTWTYFLGWVSLWAIVAVGAYGFRVLCHGKPGLAIWVGVFLALEWHLVWAAGSGMETLPYALFVLFTLIYLSRGDVNWLLLGMWIGLSSWLRPDGITLVGPAIMVLYFHENSWRKRLLAAGKLTLGIALVFIPYLVMNRVIADAWWPNTFFAKQAEYAEHRAVPLLRRFTAQAALPLVGAGLVLVPGFVLEIVSAFQRRAWGVVAGGIWFVGYLLLYAWRLPVTYQHGRYIIPAMPVYFLWSLSGLVEWIQPGAREFWRRMASRVWVLSTAMLLIVFWFLGARAYALDVAVIESEMVDTALWVADHTDPDALIAAHDIGALGFYAQRRLLDLAGLVSPEVIPFIRDQMALEAFLDANNADYLVTFPGWYPYLVSRAEPVFISGGKYSPMLGGENMTVYRWLDP